MFCRLRPRQKLTFLARPSLQMPMFRMQGQLCSYSGVREPAVSPITTGTSLQISSRDLGNCKKCPTKDRIAKLPAMNTCVKWGAPLGRAKVYLLRRNVYQQDELSPPSKVELLRVNKVGGDPLLLQPRITERRDETQNETTTRNSAWSCERIRCWPPCRSLCQRSVCRRLDRPIGNPRRL